MSDLSYVRYDDSVEVVQPGEATTIGDVLTQAYDAAGRFRHTRHVRRASEPRGIDELPA